MIEVCFFEVYLKAVSLCMCRLLLSIIFSSCTCLFSVLYVFPPCSPNSFSLFCIEKSLAVPGSVHHLTDILKKIFVYLRQLIWDVCCKPFHP